MIFGPAWTESNKHETSFLVSSRNSFRSFEFRRDVENIGTRKILEPIPSAVGFCELGKYGADEIVARFPTVYSFLSLGAKEFQIVLEILNVSGVADISMTGNK